MNNRFEGKSFDQVMEILDHGNINERAAAIALRYGGIDGSHHKQWVIDQMLRMIAGAGYAAVIAAYNSDPEEYQWDEGIAP